IDMLVGKTDDLTERHLPYPKEYLCYDPFDVTGHPALGVFISGGHDFVLRGPRDTGSMEYDTIYETTIFVSAATANLGTDDAGIPVWENPYRDASIRQRDDLLHLVAQALVDSPSLGTADGSTGFILEADLSELRVSTPEPIKIGDNRNPVWVATGFLLVNVRCSENTARPFLGVVEEMDLTFNIVNGEFQD